MEQTQCAAGAEAALRLPQWTVLKVRPTKLGCTQLKERRLNKLKKALDGNAITVVIDETGDRKKGKKTDYVARQYLGSMGKVDNGIVSVNAYEVYHNITFPLNVKVFKPKGTLKEEDKYKTKIRVSIRNYYRVN